jgi:hypothetical protein
MAADGLPFLTAFDPPQQAEGSLDPLGLYSVADALGVRLAPGVRERQSTPRYLTLALVGYTVCQGALQDLAAAKRLPAWLVFEWLVVLALVKQLRDTADFHGIPGNSKVSESLRHPPGVVCASNYLKTPSVFGFHGIYRVFGVKAGLFDTDGNPLASGRSVLQAWERDQQLEGFLTGNGPGAELRRQIENAVRRGLVNGQLEMPAASLAATLAQHLNPYHPGARERQALWSALADVDPLRGEYAHLLVSDQGQADWLASEQQEAVYQTSLLGRTSLPMRQLLQAIRAYEHLARLLTDAFDEVRWRATQHAHAVDGAWLAQGKCMQHASRNARTAFDAMLVQLGEVDAIARLRAEKALDWVGEPHDAASFALALLAHHGRVQRAKPPDGKRGWFDVYGDGRVAIRPAYELAQFQSRDGVYVHAYRTQPMWKFALDLGRAKRAMVSG